MKVDQLKKLKDKNLFCTYFAYVDFEKLKNGIYSSDYWKELLQNNKASDAKLPFPNIKIIYHSK